MTEQVRKRPGRPCTGYVPKKHFTVIGTPEEVDYIKKTFKEKGFKTRSRIVINLIMNYLNNEQKAN